MNPLEELCKLVLNILNNTEEFLKHIDSGAVLYEDFFILPLYGFEDEYGTPHYAINPYTGEVYEHYSSYVVPRTGIKVTDPELLIIIYNYLNGYSDLETEPDNEETVVELTFTVPGTIFPGTVPFTFHSLN